MHAPTASSSSQIDIPARMHPVLGALAFVPIMLIILTIMALLVEDKPATLLLPFLGLIVICCGLLSWTALQTMLGGTLEFAPDGLKIKRFLSETTYPWHEIDACKVMPATGTFGDDALTEADQRVGVGLFLRGSKRDREHDLDADVIICAGDQQNVQAMMRIASRVEAALKRAQKPEPYLPPRGAQPAGRGTFQQRRGQSQPRSAAATNGHLADKTALEDGAGNATEGATGSESRHPRRKSRRGTIRADAGSPAAPVEQPAPASDPIARLRRLQS